MNMRLSRWSKQHHADIQRFVQNRKLPKPSTVFDLLIITAICALIGVFSRFYDLGVLFPVGIAVWAATTVFGILLRWKAREKEELFELLSAVLYGSGSVMAILLALMWARIKLSPQTRLLPLLLGAAAGICVIAAYAIAMKKAIEANRKPDSLPHAIGMALIAATVGLIGSKLLRKNVSEQTDASIAVVLMMLGAAIFFSIAMMALFMYRYRQKGKGQRTP